jgi:hypothetical protein
MLLNFKALPALIALAILVAVFASISRQHTKERVRLWFVGWAFVLLRSIIQFVHPAGAAWKNLDFAIGIGALEMASVSFVVSVAPSATTIRRQLLLGSVLGLPALTYTYAMIWGVESAAFYYAVVLIALAGALSLLWSWHRKMTPYVISMGAGSIVLAGVIASGIASGNDDRGVHLILAAMYFIAAGLFWYRLRRISAGVMATVLGFIGWGAVPSIQALRSIAPALGHDAEVWNIPKYLVAVGMIVTLLEDQIRYSQHLAYHDALTGLPIAGCCRTGCCKPWPTPIALTIRLQSCCSTSTTSRKLTTPLDTVSEIPRYNRLWPGFRAACAQPTLWPAPAAMSSP